MKGLKRSPQASSSLRPEGLAQESQSAAATSAMARATRALYRVGRMLTRRPVLPPRIGSPRHVAMRRVCAGRADASVGSREACSGPRAVETPLLRSAVGIGGFRCEGGRFVGWTRRHGGPQRSSVRVGDLSAGRIFNLQRYSFGDFPHRVGVVGVQVLIHVVENTGDISGGLVLAFH